MASTTARISGLLLTLILLLQHGSDGARILCVSHQFGSHMLMVHTVAEGLIKQGHEVYTVFSDMMPIPKGLEQKGFKILKYHTPEGSQIMTSDKNSDKILDKMMKGLPQDMGRQSETAGNECVDMDKDQALETQLRSLEFDLLIIDVFPLSCCMMFLSMKHDIPFVLVPPGLDLEMMRTPILPSFTPSAISLYSDNMGFVERLKNTFLGVMLSVPALSPFPAVKDVSLIRKYSKDPEVTRWVDLARKAELFLVSRGPLLEYPFPLMPNVIDIECLTCKPAKSLDKNIEAMIAEFEGVIVVSFGSLISHFPDVIADKFLKAFAQRKELIFWRYTGEFHSAVPPNVKIMKWLPQNDLLAHPKTKLFITHSGNNGQYESVYHGVPMLAFPLFAEQPHNAVRIVAHGYGLQASIKDISADELGDKIAEIIDNPSYRERTQKAGRIMKSAPMDPRETSTYWIEHILEFGGEHLRSHALKMPWYSFYMIDILLTLQIVFIAVLVILICTCSFLVRRLRGSKSKEKIH